MKRPFDIRKVTPAQIAKSPPKITEAMGFCSICPAGRQGEDVPIVEVRHEKAQGQNFFGFCYRCTGLLVAAASKPQQQAVAS